MKKMIFTLIISLVFVATDASCEVGDGSGVKDNKREQRTERKMIQALRIDSIIASGSYTFRATKVLTSLRNQPTINFTDRYDLRVTPNRIMSFLPFFGRAQSLPIPLIESPLNFDTQDFEITIVKNEVKGEKLFMTDITIEARDRSRRFDINLKVDPGGLSTLIIRTNGLSSSTFVGEIIECEKPK